MQLNLRVVDGENPIDELHHLERWLSNEQDLRGRLTYPVADITPKGEMGGLSDVLVASLASGGAVTVLVQSIQSWIAAQRPKVSVEIKTRKGDSIRVDAEGFSPDDLTRLLKEID
ncbi:effector-associated constant component EACC1 [Pseudonocardia endophytica]|uniref:Uncharacterized protein n=1 Tax=Pseudonocardia endophytica TaxID=401976 RepID=A0A4R1HW36_PSEEN|nr:hypothetical protein EV378_1025 [Pseudonocardia endophytica]